VSTALTVLAVGIGGALGSLARYGIETAFRKHFGHTIPWWGFAINTTGAFALGMLVGYTLHHPMNRQLLAGLGTGFIGAYTMIAPVNVDGPRLWFAGMRHHAALVTIGGYALALGAATLGLWITGGI
jgi:CrcB protein